MSAETLAWWWEQHPGGGAEPLKELLDLGLGPVPIPTRRPRWWGRSAEPTRTGGEGGGEQVDDRPAGLALQQDVFLTNLHELPAGRQLDEFARGIAEGHGWDGVTCLAGVRGAGKSTILNRIAWYCRRWSGSAPPPLLIRFDLGISFEHERFARNFVEQICRRARKYCDAGPFASRVRAVTTLVAAVGHIASWCETNVKWAGIIMLLLFALIGTTQLYDPQRSPQLSVMVDGEPVTFQGEAPVTEPSQSGVAGLLNPRLPDQKIRLPLVGEWRRSDIHFLGLVLFAIIFVGAVHGARKSFPRLRPGNGRRWQWLSVLALAVPVLVGADAIYLWVRVDAAQIKASEVASAEQLTQEAPASAGVGEEQANGNIDVDAVEPSAGPAMIWTGAPPVPGFHLIGAGIEPAVRYTLGPAERSSGQRDWGTQLLNTLWVEVRDDGNPKSQVFELKEKGYDDWYLALFWPFFASLTAVALAIWMLPRWWEHYLRLLRFRQLGHQAEVSDVSRLVPAPYVSAIVSQVLPSSEDYEEIDKMSMPFLQWRTKQALEECVKAFGRVVILVDDADILPSNQFHELLRVLRPISKVQNARCVVAVPDFFFDVWKSAQPNDGHSTIGHCLFLGDPAVYVQGNDAPFKAKVKGNVPADVVLRRSKLREWLVDLLRSRLRTPLKGGTARDLASHPLFAEALKNWGFGNTEDSEAHDLRPDERFFLEERGLSRREWLRAIDERLPRHLGQHAYAGVLGSKMIERDRAKRIEDAQREFETMENVFRCDARWRSEVLCAKQNLDANGRAHGANGGSGMGLGRASNHSHPDVALAAGR